MLALVAAMLSLAPVLVACGDAGAAASRSSSSAGTLRWYGLGTPNSWDPATNSVGNNVKILSLVYSGLTRLDPAGDPVPDIASSWAWSDNGYELTFDIRPGLKFTDGTPVDAAAVKYDINRGVTDPLSLISPLLQGIKSETVVSRYVIRLNLFEQDWELPGTLAGKAGELYSPKAAADPTQLAAFPVGAGAFKVTKYVAQGYTELVKNPGYWDAKAIDIKSIYMSGDTTAADVLAAVQDGQANFAQIGPTQVAAAESAGFKVTSIQQFSVAYLAVNQAYAPYTNPLVSKAIGYAIDRKALAQVQGDGYYKVDDEPFPATYFGYDPSSKVANYWSYDPKKAAALLSQAGYPNGKGLSLTITTSLPSSLAQQLQSELQALGASVTISGIPSTETTQLEYVEHNVPLFPSSFVGRESALAGLQIVYASTGLLNPSRTASPALLNAIADLRKTPSQPRAAYLAAIDKVVQLGVEQSSVYFLYSVPLLLATKGVTGIQPYVDFQELYGVSAR